MSKIAPCKLVELAILANPEKAAVRLKKLIIDNGPDLCTTPTRKLRPDGYYLIFVLNGLVYAHRAVYTLQTLQQIPADKEINHTCRTRHCCNPNHLEAVTRQENLLYRDSPRWYSQETCSEGHPLTGDNVWISPRGRPFCRTCNAKAIAYATNAG